MKKKKKRDMEKLPISYKVYIGGTLALWLLGMVGFGGTLLNVIKPGNLFVASFTIIMATPVLLMTELSASIEYKKMVKQTKQEDKIRECFEPINKEKINDKEKQNDYNQIVISFINHFNYKKRHEFYNTDLLYKMVMGMKQSGYTNEEIAEYIVFIMYETKEDKKINKDLKLVRKLKNK